MPKPQIDWIDWFPLAGETSPKLFRYRQRGADDWFVKEGFQVELVALDLKIFQFQIPYRYCHPKSGEY